jgi:hypothetical protein
MVSTVNTPYQMLMYTYFFRHSIGVAYNSATLAYTHHNAVLRVNAVHLWLIRYVPELYGWCCIVACTGTLRLVCQSHTQTDARLQSLALAAA